jgi:hypothetical protein
MQNKAIRRNVLAATAVAAGATQTSQIEKNTWGRGIRLYVTITAVTATGTSDSFYLCDAAPATPTVAFPLVGFTAANLLATAGTWVFDFYPGGALPASLATGGQLKGLAGVELPLTWAVQAVMGAGNAATIQVDALTLP